MKHGRGAYSYFEPRERLDELTFLEIRNIQGTGVGGGLAVQDTVR